MFRLPGAAEDSTNLNSTSAPQISCFGWLLTRSATEIAQKLIHRSSAVDSIRQRCAHKVEGVFSSGAFHLVFGGQSCFIVCGFARLELAAPLAMEANCTASL